MEIPNTGIDYAVATAEQTPASGRAKASALKAYFFITYLIACAIHIRCLRSVPTHDVVAPLFAVAAYPVYMFLYLLPALLGVGVCNWFAHRPRCAGILSRAGIRPDVVTAVAAVLLAATVHVLLYADQFIHQLYGFHLNGFVWNLVFTRGGLDSLGGGSSTTLSVAMIIAGYVVLQAVVYFASRFTTFVPRAAHTFLRRRWILVSVSVLLALFAQFAYGVSYMRGYAPVLLASNALPVFFPISFNRLAESMGIAVEKKRDLTVKDDTIQLRYPLNPLQRDPSVRPLNIIWLTTESLRADMLDPEIMPNTWAFAGQSLWMRNHYSGGNGTRMGVFTMFYGLYGYYWFPFLAERRGPVFFDLLTDLNYQVQCYTGAGFSYPEFDKTVFVRINESRLHENTAFPIWKRDGENIDDALSFIDQRDPARPFFTYIFFESPHANYHFPAEAVIRTPYGKDLDYATMDLQKDIGQIKNRYINACHHLDGQVGRFIAALRERKLLENTIILFTGDHGEEFMEKGRWGHNSDYTQEQIRTPALIWIPGHAPRTIDDMTCHLDFPPTILRLLGVTNPAQDYAQGHDLLQPIDRQFLVLADWNTLAYVDGVNKVILPWRTFGFAQQEATTIEDRPLGDPDAFFQANRQRIVEMMRGLKQFAR